jgi:ATP/maltotriose-dependent transcriptional regulator MalT
MRRSPSGTLGDVGGEARTLQVLFTQRLAVSDSEGLIETLETSIPVYRKLGDKSKLVSALQILSQVLLYGRADLKRARTLAKESVTLCRELGERRGLCLALYRMGNVSYYAGDLKAGREAYEECFDLARANAEVIMIHVAAWKLAAVSSARGDLPAAESRIQDAMHDLRKITATDVWIMDAEIRLALAQLRRDQGKPAAPSESAGRSSPSWPPRRNWRIKRNSRSCASRGPSWTKARCPRRAKP